MARRALVLGGGGPVGIAWETGLAAGLAEHGIDLREADIIVGTSAGSAVGAQLALGRVPSEMVTAIKGQAGAAPPAATGSAPAPAADLTELMRLMARAASGESTPEAARAELGQFALRAQTPPEETFIAGFGRTLSGAAWPSRRFTCTAVDTADGSFVTWDNDSGVPLAAAVASSCSVPGIVPPITINGRRYMDGGMRSATNIDLVAGYDVVLAVVVRAAELAAGNPMAEASKQRLESELDAVRNAGGAVEVIAPDDAAIEVFGVNLMDFSRRTGAVDAGVRQGRAEAERLKDFWK
ncbi:MAG: patatin-like phospholipase family protein [Tepidiformaceae bacterium]